MTAEFDWWLLIVGLVAGAGLVWLILAEWPRRDEELEDAEIGLEAGWIAAQLRATGRALEPETAEAVLRQHRAYLRLPPPDELPVGPAPGPSTPQAPGGHLADEPGPTAPMADEPGPTAEPPTPDLPFAPRPPGS